MDSPDRKERKLDPVADPVSDEVLVQQAREDPSGPSGRAAAEQLFERYQRKVYLWCCRRVGNHELALDLAQDVLLSAYRYLGAFEGRCLYSSWLFTIMRHRCYRALRTPSLLEDDETDSAALPDAQPTPESALIDREEMERTLRMMEENLEPREQLALWLRCYERLSVDEITRRLEISAATGARGVLQSARRKLRAAMKRTGRMEGRPRS